MRDLNEALSALEEQSGTGFAAVRRLLCRLASAGRWDIGDLVEDTGVPHRRVMETLRALGFDATDGEVVLEGEQRREIQAHLSCTEAAPDPEEEERHLNLLTEIAAGLPPSVWNLDHVPATPATIFARAGYLTRNYALARAHLVCLGDHDLTAVATKLLAPGATVSVVDIDERLLEYLDGVSQRLGLELRLRSADLRVGLPRDLEGQADLVFTDPPYSREGVDLFVRRAVEALAERPGSSLLFCYGAGDRAAEEVLAVQERLAHLHLVLDALLPGFNRYRGAHAIGAASSLWVCRPTRRTRPAVGAVAGGDARIYSRGRASRESAVPEMPREVRALVERDSALPVDPVELIRSATELPHRRPHRHWPATLVVDLGRFYGASMGRVLLATPAGSRLLVVGEGRALTALQGGPVRRLVGARFTVEMLLEPTRDCPGVLSATPLAAGAGDETDLILRYLQDHQGARVRNAWREAIIAAASRQGRVVTKNQARAAIDATPMRPSELDAHLLDLPQHCLGRLVEAVESVVRSGAGGLGQGEGGGPLLGAPQQQELKGGAGS